MRIIAAFCVVFLALPVAAKTLAEISDERTCVQDSDCVLVEGACGPTAVNKDYQTNAAEYYKKQGKTANCVSKFWVPKEMIAECKPLAGSKANKDAAVVPHSSCKAVAKPKEQNKK